MTRPTSTETFPNRKAASVLDDAIEFHGAKLQVKVSNPCRTDLFRNFPITVTAHRTVTLAEDGVECSVDGDMVRLRTGLRKPKTEPPYGAVDEIGSWSGGFDNVEALELEVRRGGQQVTVVAVNLLEAGVGGTGEM